MIKANGAGSHTSKYLGTGTFRPWRDIADPALRVAARVASTEGPDGCDYRDHGDVCHHGLECGRLPVPSDVLVFLDRHPAGIAIDSIVAELLAKTDGVKVAPETGETIPQYEERVAAARVSQRVAFMLRVEEIVGRFVADKTAAWVKTTTGARVARRVVDLAAIGDMAIAAGEDPEAAMAKADPSYVPRYREGCTFWRRDGFGGADPGVVTWAMVGYFPVDRAGDRNGNYWLNVNRVPVISTYRPAMGTFYALDGATERAIGDGWWRKVKKAPEHIARRLEQRGWVPWHEDTPPAWLTDMEAALDRELAPLRAEVERGLSEPAWFDDLHEVVPSVTRANHYAPLTKHGPVTAALASGPSVDGLNDRFQATMGGDTPADAHSLGVAVNEMVGTYLAHELARNGREGLRFFFADETGSNTCTGALTLDTYKQAVTWMRGYGITADTVLIDFATPGGAKQALDLLGDVDTYNADVAVADRLPIPKVIPAPLNNPGTCYVVSTTGPGKPLTLQMRESPWLTPSNYPPGVSTPFLAHWRIAALPGDSRTIYRIQAPTTAAS